jgi:alpha-beta hydrolase superfamily lysophospholipase
MTSRASVDPPEALGADSRPPWRSARSLLRRRRRVGAGTNGSGAAVSRRLRREASATASAVVIAMLLLAGCAPGQDSTRPVAAAPIPASPGPRFTADAFVTGDGAVLPLRRWLPAGPPKAVILALHGFNDYSHAFAGPGAAWARDGIATFAYDQRGFGAAPARGFWAGRVALAADADAAVGVLHRLYPRVPVYLLGESMGGAVAIVAVTGAGGLPPPAVAGVILAAPAVWGRTTMGLLPRLALWAGVRLLPALTLTGRGLHIEPSDNIAMLRALSRDPLVIKATRVDTVWGLVNLMDRALAAAPRLDAPLLLLYGAHDQIIPPGAMRRFVEMLPPDPPQPRRIALYRRGYHMLLRDLDAAIPERDVASWVFDRAASLPSGADDGATAALLRDGSPAG